MFRHEFRRTPLSAAVPLEGSDTVVGLRELEHQQRRETLQSIFGAVSGDGAAKGRTAYKGPRLAELRLEDLRRRERPWQVFLHGGEGTAWSAAYNLPEHVAHLCARCEENVVHYLGNYLRVAAAVALLVVYTQPLALVGFGCAFALLLLNLTLLAPPGMGPGERPAGAARPLGTAARTQNEGDDGLLAALRLLLTLGTGAVRLR
ncbi:hypothetical protein WJX81_003625 [Elliptochloris bilobata]|uniref:PRA1 family protein n=1 Tax=Elliptochloris bilobata TaxID=381761 RepID=A0AAW1QLT7_9CHLO